MASPPKKPRKPAPKPPPPAAPTLQRGDLTMRDLEYVLAVAEHLSFSRAAEATTVSQPALSRQIQQLERGLGVPLFERSKRHVALTRAGQAFCVEAARLLDQAGTLIERTMATQQPLSGAFRLGAITSSGPYLLPHCLKPLQSAYPALELFIREGLTDPLMDALRAGKLDAVIAATTVDDPQLSVTPLFFEPFVVASAREETSETLPATLGMGMLDLDHMLLLEDGHCLKDQTLSFCTRGDSARAFRFQASSLETLLHMAATGLGFAVIPELAIPKNPDLADLIAISRFNQTGVGRTMALYARKTYPDTASLDALAAVIRAAYHPHPASAAPQPPSP
ncbi:MAG: LysR substrate-binding domain-containing protein [Candidatus Melainabacteria bacterium]